MTTSMPGPEEWDPEFTLLTESSLERFKLDTTGLRAIATGDFDASSPGDEILLSRDTIIEPGRHDSSLIVGTLADGRVQRLYTVAEWDQRARGVTLADNGDGRSDIFVVVDTEPPRHYEQYLGRVEVFLNSDDGFGPPLVSPVYDSIASFDLIDADGDGMQRDRWRPRNVWVDDFDGVGSGDDSRFREKSMEFLSGPLFSVQKPNARQVRRVVVGQRPKIG